MQTEYWEQINKPSISRADWDTQLTQICNLSLFSNFSKDRTCEIKGIKGWIINKNEYLMDFMCTYTGIYIILLLLFTFQYKDWWLIHNMIFKTQQHLQSLIRREVYEYE